MAMHRVLFAALLLAGTGCLGGDDGPGAPAGGPTPGGPGTGGWMLDCTLGSYETGPWAQRCLARASHTPGHKQEIWLAVNPNDPGNVVIGSKDLNPDSSAQCVWNDVSVTHDGGATWTDVTIGGAYADRQPGDPWFGYACNTDPMLAFGADGDVHYGVEVYNFGSSQYETPLSGVVGSVGLLGWKILLATSHDGGDTWPDVITLQPDLVTVTDYSRMTVSPATGTILEAINNIGTAFTCHVLSSRDGGATADPPIKATPLDQPGTAGCQAIAAAPDGTVVIGFTRGVDAGTETYWLRSTDDGRTWTDGNTGFGFAPIAGFEENQFRTGTNFEIAFDLSQGPRSGTLYAIYGDTSAGDADLFVRSSPDHGATWGEAARVNDDTTGNDQFLPNIAVAADGSFHAFFMDKRWDPGNRLLDVTHAVSLDGGATWFNERVTDVSFDGDLGRHQSGAPFIGDYIGVGAAGDSVWAGVPDSSDGEITVVAAARVVRPGPTE